MTLNDIKLINRQALDMGGVPGGYDAIIIAKLAQAHGQILFVARDDVHLDRIAQALNFFAPQVRRLEFPAWDCLPYDRASPHSEILGRRIDTLTRLLQPADECRVVLSTVSALLQRIPPRSAFENATLSVRVGETVRQSTLIDFLITNGYGRSDTVMEPGEFAIRGGIVDIFPSGADQAVRLDFFGDDLDAIRTFDCMDQRSTGKLDHMALKPVNEVPLDEHAQERFRTAYRKAFGAVGDEDMLYQAVTSGQRYIGMEHWLPLFYKKLETLFDYLPKTPVVLDYQWQQAMDARLDLIAEYYAARLNISSGTASESVPYLPVKPDTF
ncbi:MAG TPA: transcription-repair coupling factor, partial [Rhodospirillales bacterium]|nr:transcription-repair coupling factor [Rhodospirillales bacterium]